MARVLLAGGEGFVGAHLASRLRGDGHHVASFDAGLDFGRASRARRAEVMRHRREVLLAGCELLQGDVRDRGALGAALRATRPDVVVGLANLPLADVAAADPAAARTGVLDASTAVLRACVQHGVPRLVHVSSSMVYGDFTRDPQPEDAACRPLGPYGQRKLDAERALRRLAADHATEVVVVRPSAVYGPGDLNGRVLDRLVAAAATGGAFCLDAPASTALDFTHVRDLAAGIALACFAPRVRGATLNLTRGVARTLGEAIALLPEVDVDVAAPRDDVPRRGALDVSRARELLGFRPEIDLEDGLDELLALARPAVTA